MSDNDNMGLGAIFLAMALLILAILLAAGATIREWMLLECIDGKTHVMLDNERDESIYYVTEHLCDE